MEPARTFRVLNLLERVGMRAEVFPLHFHREKEKKNVTQIYKRYRTGQDKELLWQTGSIVGTIPNVENPNEIRY